MSGWQYSEPLITTAITCDECGGNLSISDNHPAEVTVYTRVGTQFRQHFTKVCPNRWCRKKFLCGYTIKNDEKIYAKLNHTSKHLVTSNETAFTVDYLYEVTLHFLHSNATFMGLADIYNQFHNFSRQNITRNNLCHKRLASGFFLYGFLEMSSRYQIYPKLSTDRNWIDDAILENHTLLRKVFSIIWSRKHECSFEDCETMMVTDGNMKLNRKVCAAKFSVVRHFQHSNKTVLTGCTSMPSPESPFCAEHVNAETPVLLAEKISKETKGKLLSFKEKHQTSNLKLPQDSVFTVEAILNAKNVNNDIQYLVKFAGYPISEACWEPCKNLPTFITEYYKDKSKHGSPLPTPSIKHTRKVDHNSEIYHHLEWKTTKHSGRELKLQNGETLFDLDMDKLAADEIRSSCNTRKLKDKRDRRHSAGIIIHAKPCGKIPHVDELFNCESINQVYGSIIEFLGNLDKEEREKIRIWLFDDMCHLKPYSEKTKQAKQNEVTEFFSNLPKAVDKFHFPGHKRTDKYCQENCNPNVELKKLDIKKQNTPACEQAFKWLNGYKNLKTMNEPRFKMFLLYMIDLHNLAIDDSVDLAANPLNPKREEAIQKQSTVSKRFESAQTDKSLEKVISNIENQMKIVDGKEVNKDEKFEKMEVEKEVKFEDCFSETNGEMSCNFCPGTYKREGHLRNHLESKHNKTFKIVCSCGKLFPDSTRLSRHKKTCKHSD